MSSATAAKLVLAMLFLNFGSVVGAEEAPQLLSDILTQATSANVITLPAGVFKGSVKLRAGMTLKGAGFDRTTIDASASIDGIAGSGNDIRISDLTVRNAQDAGISIEYGRHASVERVRAIGSSIGIQFKNVDEGLIANTVSARNHFGIVFNGGNSNSLINCTLADNLSTGLSARSGERLTAFNNCITGSVTGVFIGKNTILNMDHNLYNDTYVGRLQDQNPRTSVLTWNALTHLDAHSVQMAIEYLDAEAADYRASPSSRTQIRIAPSSWGVAEFVGVAAPGADITGAPRAARPDVGAYESPIQTNPHADGTFTIESDAGLKSAGIFSPAGVEIGYLFQNLPLAKGQYEFRFPARDFQDRAVSAGDYQVRIVESDLQWDYLGWTRATTPPPTQRIPLIAYTAGGDLLLAESWTEDRVNVRSFDGKSGKAASVIPGSDEIRALASDVDGAFLIHLRCGTTAEVPTHQYLTAFSGTSGEAPATREIKLAGPVTGMAVLGDQLFIYCAAGLYHSPKGGDSFTTPIVVGSLSSLVSDNSTSTLWAISDSKRIVALDANAKILADVTPVEDPAALAASNGRLAVASRKTGKVHIFDATTPGELKEIAAIGRGDGPFGPALADRFWFQSADGWTGAPVSLALSPEGCLSVAEANRVMAFDQAGTLLWSGFDMFGNAQRPCYPDNNRICSADGRITAVKNVQTGSWSLEAFWDCPKGAYFYGRRSAEMREFGFLSKPGVGNTRTLIVGEYENYRFRPTLELAYNIEKKTYLLEHNAKKVGDVDRQEGSPLLDKSGNAISYLPVKDNSRSGYKESAPLEFDSNVRLCADGDLIFYKEYTCRSLKFLGLDANGAPSYSLAGATEPSAQSLFCEYTGTMDNEVRFTGITPYAGGFIANIIPLSCDVAKLCWHHDYGVSLAGLDPQMKIRWANPGFLRQQPERLMISHDMIAGQARVDGMNISARSSPDELLVYDDDGLGLGSFGPPSIEACDGRRGSANCFGSGAVYRAKDGYIYAMASFHSFWFRLRNENAIRKRTVPVTLTAERAEALAREVDPAGSRVNLRGSGVVIEIPEIGAPLPIDGDLEKWRRLNICPQAILTPLDERVPGITGGPVLTVPIKGPRDFSAVARFAHHNDELYVQVLKFDDVANFTQSAAMHWAQDEVELAINGYSEGFKFDVTEISGKAEMYRSRRNEPALDKVLPAEIAPRQVKVLDDASAVSERAVIEAALGLDLSTAKVEVFEFKLPLNESTFSGAAGDAPKLTGAQPWRLGLFLFDSDGKGAPPHWLAWPPRTYTTFMPKEAGAAVVWK